MLKGAYWVILLLWLCSDRAVGITCVFQLASQSPRCISYCIEEEQERTYQEYEGML